MMKNNGARGKSVDVFDSALFHHISLIFQATGSETMLRTYKGTASIRKRLVISVYASFYVLTSTLRYKSL